MGYVISLGPSLDAIWCRKISCSLFHRVGAAMILKSIIQDWEVTIQTVRLRDIGRQEALVKVSCLVRAYTQIFQVLGYSVK